MRNYFLLLTCLLFTACGGDKPTALYKAPSTGWIVENVNSAQNAATKAKKSNLDAKDEIREAKVIGLSLHDKLELLRKRGN